MQGSPTSIIQGHVLRESQLSGANKKTHVSSCTNTILGLTLTCLYPN